ncbi:hypothetical protein XAB3213_4960002 [Xanthomonas citri pv. bilvae]|nr:hypothetical protein XAB3213_4960002 [Xanthomonas citri pv. bilvae]
MDRVVVAERDRSGGRDGYIEAVTVIHLVELVLRLEVAQLGIGQHGSRPDSAQIPRSENRPILAQNNNKIIVLRNFNTMHIRKVVAWYRRQSHGIEAFNAIHHAMKKRCLAMPNVARRCRTKSQKSPQ